MKDIVVRPLRENEKKRFFEFARSLPERDFWGKKGRFLRGDFQTLQGFFAYIDPFEPKCFLIAEDDNKFAGFVVAIYNPEWVSDLMERYEHDVDKRAYILGIAFIDRRKDVLSALSSALINYFSRRGIQSVEYPTLGNVCLTTATDVLIPENVDALMMFREAGFKISECYYSMKLDLSTYRYDKEIPLYGAFRFRERSIEIVQKNEVLGKIAWNPVENGKTDIDIYVTQAHRGKGFGTALMAEALHQLGTQGIKIIELGVDGNNVTALKLYRKFGFEVHATHFYIIVSARTLPSERTLFRVSKP